MGKADNTLALVLLVLLTLLPHEAFAAGSLKNSSGPRASSDSYCGLYCLYVAINLTGKDISFTDLLKPEYIGRKKGSSLAELKRAAKDNNLYSMCVSNLSIRALKQWKQPVILNVKTLEGSTTTRHYVLFLGTRGDRAMLYDPPNPIAFVPLTELAAQWSGQALVISEKPIAKASLFMADRMVFAMWMVVIVLLLLVAHWVKRRFFRLNGIRKPYHRIGLSIGQVILLTIAAMLTALVFHVSNGYLSHPTATAAIQNNNQDRFIPKVSFAKVCRLQDDVTFIDARLSNDYEVGHIKGAINISVDVNDAKLQQQIRKIDRNSRLIVYCQSSGCSYASEVAVKLIELGFSNVLIFRGGWNEWIKGSAE